MKDTWVYELFSRSVTVYILVCGSLTPWSYIQTSHLNYNSWNINLMHYATSRKVAGSNPDEVDFFLIYLFLPATLWPWGRLRL
jgi:hypothetical protein